jgi:hypothetical protein
MWTQPDELRRVTLCCCPHAGTCVDQWPVASTATGPPFAVVSSKSCTKPDESASSTVPVIVVDAWLTGKLPDTDAIDAVPIEVPHRHHVARTHDPPDLDGIGPVRL